MLEEAYLYIDMPAPGWGVQFVYTDPQNPELVVVVREGDVVAMPAGYHPNVASPGCSVGFLWMMAAARETEDRLFGVVNVHPDFAQGGSGLREIHDHVHQVRHFCLGCAIRVEELDRDLQVFKKFPGKFRVFGRHPAVRADL